MIFGQVQPAGVFFSIFVADRHDELHRFDVLLDTGFTGSLTLTPEIIAALGLPVDSEVPVIVGDGSIQTFRRHIGTVEWAARRREIEIHAVSGIPVIGMGLLQEGVLYLECRDGGKVTFDWLPE